MTFPLLSSLILLPLLGSLFIFFIKEKTTKNYQSIKYVALFVSFSNFVISLYLWYLFDNSISDFQFVEEKVWIKDFINYKVGVDGISILFIILTTFIVPLCVVSINSNIKSRLKEFLIAVLIMESFMMGVFCSLDLIIFYLFFEGGLIPMFLIIGIWGGSRRVYSAFKFFFVYIAWINFNACSYNNYLLDIRYHRYNYPLLFRNSPKLSKIALVSIF